MIEVPHEADKLECLRSIQILLSTGSHFLTNADWGRADNVHSAWITLEAENKDEARRVIPPAYRARDPADRIRGDAQVQISALRHALLTRGPAGRWPVSSHGNQQRFAGVRPQESRARNAGLD
jgi:hypothetical protein